MAVRKTRLPHIVDTETRVTLSERKSEVPGNDSPSADMQGPSLHLAVAVFGAWILALVALAATSANPITLNRQQILGADVVIEALVSDLAEGKCEVRRSWPEEVAGESVTVERLAGLPIAVDEAYLLPLAGTGAGTYEIVLTAPPDSAPLIYPATDASRRQLEALLKR